ncbi:cytochrome P450 [Macroventuria anomochaeta]|uniref:Cytochrome P450 n=1 Tax=Macroventuria anomochaeta TaxID=301207 RepID=A0ACB6SG37_9PLEO|nr:cytochrome P450 [Macroventuria anomochaeta]KAF2633131.1 cytochrome P450 [Macroventuria anomochaeta]
MAWSISFLEFSPLLHVLLLVSVPAGWVGWILYARCIHPLAKFPGPLLASVTRLWLIFDVASGNAEKSQRRLHEKYAPDEVAIADPDAIKTIYGAHSGFTKTDFYLPFRATWGRYPDAFTNLDERQHAERRRIVSSLYSLSNILQLEEGIDACIEMLVGRLKERAATNRAVDMAEWVQWYAFDVIGELFFSRKFGFMENAHDHQRYIHALDLVTPFLAVACVMPAYMRPFFLASGAMVPRVFRALNALKHIESASDACVAEGRLGFKCDRGRKDMLDGFFDIWHKKGEAKDFTLMEVKMEVYGTFIAGSDTTAAAITAILYHLVRTPSAYAKLTAEIDEATASGLLSLPTVQYHEAVGLPYLVACCKEGMRLHPSVGLTLPRHVPAGGCIIAGECFPEGTRVGVNAAVVQRDRKIFGEDADEFVPERWFRKGAARIKRVMFQFGGGSRTCIGKNISLCEMYKLIPQLLRSFHITPSEPEKEWETHNYWFNKPSKVRMMLSTRTHGSVKLARK